MHDTMLLPPHKSYASHDTIFHFCWEGWDVASNHKAHVVNGRYEEHKDKIRLLMQQVQTVDSMRYWVQAVAIACRVTYGWVCVFLSTTCILL